MNDILFHIHSKFSFDSQMEPEKIVREVKRLGYRGVAIVDHGSIQGGLEAKKFAPADFQVVVGGEYRSEYGDIIGMGLKKNITATKARDIISEIKSQGGKVVWAHPFRTYLLPRGKGRRKPLPPEDFIKSLDYIETYNAQTRPSQNALAIKAAKKFKIDQIAGLDAHFYFEIKKIDSNNYNIFGYIGTFFSKIFRVGGAK